MPLGYLFQCLTSLGKSDSSELPLVKSLQNQVGLEGLILLHTDFWCIVFAPILSYIKQSPEKTSG